VNTSVCLRAYVVAFCCPFCLFFVWRPVYSLPFLLNPFLSARARPDVLQERLSSRHCSGRSSKQMVNLCNFAGVVRLIYRV